MSSFGRPVCSVAEWVPHSAVLASGVDSVCGPLANEGVGLGPSSSGLSPSSGVGSSSAAWQVISFTWALPCVGFPAWLAC